MHTATVIDLGAGGDGLKNQRTHERQRRLRLISADIEQNIRPDFSLGVFIGKA
jgi:hypothetical protein